MIIYLHSLNQSRCAPGLFRHFPAGKSEEPIFFIFHFSFFTRKSFFPWGRKFSPVGPQFFRRCFGLTVQRYDIKKNESSHSSCNTHRNQHDTRIERFRLASFVSFVSRALLTSTPVRMFFDGPADIFTCQI